MTIEECKMLVKTVLLPSSLKTHVRLDNNSKYFGIEEFIIFAAEHIKLTVTHMKLTSCLYDMYSVVIYNGENDNAPLLGQYCGEKIPRMISGGSALHIVVMPNSYRFFFTYSVVSSGN